jgi:hypothetical protein
MKRLHQYAEILQEKDAFYKLLHYLFEKPHDPAAICKCFYDALHGSQKDNTSAYYIGILQHLSASDYKYEDVKEIFIAALDTLLSKYSFNIDEFKQFKFPSDTGKWEDAENIVYENIDDPEKYAGIPNKIRLHQDIVNFFLTAENGKKEKIDSQLEKNSKAEEGEYTILDGNSKETDIKTVDIWLKGAERNIVGFFLYILKGNFRKTAENLYLSKELIDDIKNHFIYQQPSKDLSISYTPNKEVVGKLEKGKIYKVAGHEVWNSNITSENMMENFTSDNGFSVKIKLKNNNMKLMYSLIGRKKLFDLEENFDFDMPDDIGGDYKIIEITLPKINKDVPDNKIISIIKKVLGLGYYQLNPQEKLFNFLMKRALIKLDACKMILFDGIISFLQELSKNNIQKLKEHIKEYDKLIENKVMDKDDACKKSDILLKIEKCKEKIMQAIEKAPDIQAEIRTAITAKMGNNQYGVSSIASELFQNADDALKQRISYTENLDPSQKGFSITWNGGTLQFSHFGRGINYAPADTSDEQANRWHYDLINMLKLNCSDKEKTTDTGKFGLGFKSVYFAADEPQIYCEDTKQHFCIKAGFYPEEIESEKIKAIQLKEHETRFILDTNDENKVETILRDFTVNAFFQTVFSKAIKTITIDKKPFSYKPEIFFKSVYGCIEKSDFEGKRYIAVHIKGKDSVTFIFEYQDTENEKIIKSLDGATAKLWTTTPLGTDKDLGFAINADFQVDTGRKTIVQDSPKNKDIIENAGNALGSLLAEISSKNIITIASVFDVLLSAYEKSSLLKDLPVFVVKAFEKMTGKYPLGNGCFFEAKENQSILYPEKPLEDIFEKDSSRNIRKFLEKYMPSSRLITARYYTFYQNNHIEIPQTKPLKDFFSLLHCDALNELQDTMLKDFDELLKQYSCENTRPSEEFSVKVKTTAGTWEQANTIFIPGLREYNHFKDFAPSVKILDKSYSQESCAFLSRYARPYSPTYAEMYDWFNAYQGGSEKEAEKLIAIINLFGLDIKKLADSWIYEKYQEYLNKMEDANGENIDEFDPAAIVEPFPSQPIGNLDKLIEQIHNTFKNADSVKYEKKELTIRTSRNEKEEKEHIEYRYRGYCQMCEEQNNSWEIAEIFLEPQKEIKQMNLSFCPNCAAEYRNLRNNDEVMEEFRRNILDVDLKNVQKDKDGTLQVSLGYSSIRFTATHLAEIQTLLRSYEIKSDPQTP